MNGIIRMWKKIGETPLQTLARTRDTYSIDDDITACYTGRLDPLAQGLIVILFGTEIHRAPEFNSRDKIYQFQAILGVSTDSYDAMGHITRINSITYTQAQQYLNMMIKTAGSGTQPVPPCSSYRYKGKPLWMHHRSGTLPDVLPTKNVNIYNISLLCPNPLHMTLSQYRTECLDDINDVTVPEERSGVFPINEIIQKWKLCDDNTVLYKVLLRAHVSSGTYIRSLVYDVGHSIGVPAHAFRITRICL